MITENNDGTTTVNTNKIDVTRKEVSTVIKTLKQNDITTYDKIESLQYTEGPRSIQYIAVLADKNNNPTKQVTITEDKETKKTTVIDYTTIEVEAKYIKPVQPEVKEIPLSDYYKPEVKELIKSVETQVEETVDVRKVKKI